MLAHDDVVTGVDYDDELETVVVRTQTVTNHEEKLAKKTRTSGCAVGTVFGDMMEGLEDLNWRRPVFVPHGCIPWRPRSIARPACI